MTKQNEQLAIINAKLSMNNPAARPQGIKKLVNTLSFVIPAEAGIQRKKDWIPHPPIKDFEGRQVQNDRNKETLQQDYRE